MLDDSIAEDRELRICAGLAWGAVAEATVVYVDRGVSAGMEKGIADAKAAGRPIEYRRIEPIISDFEFNEQVLVPAGDGQPAQWKRKGDLTLSELARHMQGLRDNVDQQMKRAQRYSALVPISVLLNDEEMDEFRALKITLEAWKREQERRKSAIDRDIAAGHYRTWVEERNRVARRLEEDADRVLDCFNQAEA